MNIRKNEVALLAFTKVKEHLLTLCIKHGCD